MNKSQNTHKTNLIFAAVLLTAALLLYLVFSLRPDAGVAVLTYGRDHRTMEFPLDQDGLYDVDTGLYTVHIQVEAGAARFANSPCPDHLCEGYGWLRQDGDSATCLPAMASLMVLEKT